MRWVSELYTRRNEGEKAGGWSHGKEIPGYGWPGLHSAFSIQHPALSMRMQAGAGIRCELRNWRGLRLPRSRRDDLSWGNLFLRAFGFLPRTTSNWWGVAQAFNLHKCHCPLRSDEPPPGGADSGHSSVEDNSIRRFPRPISTR
jgi:hypothetical protein